VIRFEGLLMFGLKSSFAFPHFYGTMMAKYRNRVIYG